MIDMVRLTESKKKRKEGKGTKAEVMKQMEGGKEIRLRSKKKKGKTKQTIKGYFK